MNIEGNEVTFTRPNDSKEMKTIHGTTRANFNNMVVGVAEGFQKSVRTNRGWIPCTIARIKTYIERWLLTSSRNHTTSWSNC